MLKIAVYLKEWPQGELSKLQKYEIAVLNPLESLRLAQGGSLSGSIDAALLDAMEASQRSCFIERCQSEGVGVVVMAKPNDDQFSGYFRPGVHGVVPANVGLGEIAGALWSAHRQATLLRDLATELNALRQESKNRKLIDQAVAAIATLSNVSEADALRNLRHISRNQRRPMHELATIVVEAYQLMNSMLRVDHARDSKSRVVAYRSAQ